MLTREASIVEETHFVLTRNMAENLYIIADLLGFADKIKYLNNEIYPEFGVDSPQKILETLYLLKIIDFIKDVFVEYDPFDNGYILNVNKIKQESIKYLKDLDSHATLSETDQNRLKLIDYIKKNLYVKIEKVQSYCAVDAKFFEENKDKVIIHCPESIIKAFQNLVSESRLTNASYFNPYTEKFELFPSKATNFTAIHLEILSRNESQNMDGIFKTQLYNNNLTAEQIYSLRFMSKFIVITGFAQANAYGGYKTQNTPNQTPIDFMIVDSKGFQFQGDQHNCGAIFVYHDNPEKISANYLFWQKEMYKIVFKSDRPESKSPNSIAINWYGQTGFLDLNLIKKGFEYEFTQAFFATAEASKESKIDKKINFRFLKAGLGFFCQGIAGFESQDRKECSKKLSITRIEAISIALERIYEIYEQDSSVIGNIKKLQLPYSKESKSKKSYDHIDQMENHFLDKIEEITKKLGITFDKNTDATQIDALKPDPDFLVATTNTADMHAMIGNEGNHASVDASIATNCNSTIHILNPACNPNIKLRYYQVPYKIEIKEEELTKLSPEKNEPAQDSLSKSTKAIETPDYLKASGVSETQDSSPRALGAIETPDSLKASGVSETQDSSPRALGVIEAQDSSPRALGATEVIENIYVETLSYDHLSKQVYENLNRLIQIFQITQENSYDVEDFFKITINEVNIPLLTFDRNFDGNQLKVEFYFENENLRTIPNQINNAIKEILLNLFFTLSSELIKNASEEEQTSSEEIKPEASEQTSIAEKKPEASEQTSIEEKKPEALEQKSIEEKKPEASEKTSEKLDKQMAKTTASTNPLETLPANNLQPTTAENSVVQGAEGSPVSSPTRQNRGNIGCFSIFGKMFRK